MAFALLGEYLSINSSNVSTYVKSATLTLDAAQLDSTTMGDDWSEVTGGVKSGSLSVEFVDSITDTQIDDILFALFGTVVTFELRGDDAAVSSSNPKYTGNVFIAQHSLGGSHGELAMKSLTFPTSGAVTRSDSA